MLTTPTYEYRPEQPYIAIPAQVPIPFGSFLNPLWKEAASWLQKNSLTPSGAPFIRYLTTDMSSRLDIEVGFPVSSVVRGDSRIVFGLLPAGRYAVLTYTGPYKGKGIYKANVAMMEWGEKNRVRWDKTVIDGVDHWSARVEWYLTDPEQELDTKKYETVLAILTTA